ncbi:MAG: GAF domain-containing protein [Variovorax sp.]|nr:GAF domain-containing protein [Variovorax sp.]
MHRFELQPDVTDDLRALRGPQGAPGLESATAIEALRQSEAWLAGQNEAFRCAINGAPLETSLGVLVRTALQQAPGEFRCAFYIADRDGVALRHVTGLPEACGEPLDAFRIGLDAPGCGVAVFTGKPVITRDVNESPRWVGWRDLAARHGFRACWSFPVETSSGRIIGSFSMYFARPRDATPRDYMFAAAMTQAASIIISRHQEAEERGRVQAALRASEERYRSLFDSIDEGVCLVEVLFDEAGAPADYRFLETNSVFQKQSGLGDAVGRTALELVPDLERRWINAYGRVALTGEAVHIEDESTTMNRWFDVYALPLDGPGSPLLAIVFRDITARKRREERAALLDRIGTDLARLSAPDEIMQVVGARIGEALRLSTCVFVEVGARQDEVTVHYGWMTAEVPDLRQTYRLKDYLSDDFVRAGRAGEVFLVTDTATDPRTDPERYARLKIGAFITIPFHWEGRWTAYLAATSTAPRVWRDDEVELLQEISSRLFSRIERARAEEALRESRARLARDLEDTRRLQKLSGLLIEDGSGAELHQEILETAMAIMGADFGSIQMFDPDRDVLRLLAWRNFQPEAAEHWRSVCVETATPCGMALRHQRRIIVPDVRADDAPIDRATRDDFALCGIVAAQSTPLTARDGRLIGMISTHWSEPHKPDERQLQLFDILARQAADYFERRRAEAALKMADRRKDEFLATLAHELRNPLAPIRNGVQLLRLTETPSQSQVIDMIDRQGTHLVRLVDDLMEVSRITRGKIALRCEILELGQVLRAALETAGPVLQKSRTLVQLDLPTGPVLVHADAVRLGQVFTNLLNNAAKYTDPGGRITLALCQSEDADGAATAEVRVSDTGTGIPAEMLPRVFDLFSQVDRTLGRAQGGLGIGLALVKSLVELQGGRVEALSDGPGLGSAFVVRLPAIAGSAAAEPAPADEDAQPIGRPLAGRRIVVVDDNRDAADSMALILGHLGAEVRTAYGGREAIEVMREHHPSVMLLDLGMPGMDGYELAREIRRDASLAGVTLVALTGWGQDHDLRRARDAGFDHHLVKPADRHRLLELLLAR